MRFVIIARDGTDPEAQARRQAVRPATSRASDRSSNGETSWLEARSSTSSATWSARC
jgi:hypothetical protein